ncbi:DMP19 family protein [Flavobacterium agrisoli]|uniref:DNA mimic protein DMP19 C-terminal domain-containing protein n=1 Tax=Flavobacterium agrisoli TaxID=2793066 RepID=A0A934PM39_9FLAO|nr:hypothetical protein [Flavobacterium agrisoli]MBK0369458.1 hypothetical protein [Flavobacterium agrisoli]
MENLPIIVSENAFNSPNPQDIIHSNISIINLMREEGLDDELIHDDALLSYYLDYYVAQCTQGEFAQFVYHSGWDAELNLLLEEGLQLIGANDHLVFFQQQVKKVSLMSTVKRDKFFKGKLEGVNAIRDAINENSFAKIEENLTELNAAFLKSHPDLQALPIETIFTTLEEIVGHEIKRM